MGVSGAAATFEPRLAPCGRTLGGEQYLTEDHQGLVTEVQDVHHVDRGYPDFVDQLRGLGVTIERVERAG